MMLSNAALCVCFVTALHVSQSITSGFAPKPPLSLTRTKVVPPLQTLLLHASTKRSEDPNDNDVKAENDASSNLSRRGVLSALGTVGALSSMPTTSQAISATATTPLADLPMIRLRLPQQGIGRDYIAIQLKIKGEGPYDFMVDSGLTTELITPHLQQSLGIGLNSKNTVTGLGAGGDTQGGALVQLKDASLCCGKFAKNQDLPLPPLYAVVTDFPQEHIDPTHNVEGMLGMELLNMFDVDLDFRKGRVRFWEPGTAAAAAARDGLVAIPSVVLNESLLLGIRVTSPQQKVQQPLIGILDCGSSNTLLNYKAAEILGLSTDPKSYAREPAMMGLGVDGRPQAMPTTMMQFTFAGDATQKANGRFEFEPPPSNWKPWDPVRVGIGDLPVFSQLLGDGKTPYDGPAVLVGLDVLSQRRVILETGKTRARRVFVSPK